MIKNYKYLFLAIIFIIVAVVLNDVVYLIVTLICICGEVYEKYDRSQREGEYKKRIKEKLEQRS